MTTQQDFPIPLHRQAGDRVVGIGIECSVEATVGIHACDVIPTTRDRGPIWLERVALLRLWPRSAEPW